MNKEVIKSIFEGIFMLLIFLIPLLYLVYISYEFSGSIESFSRLIYQGY